jgi:hypothetical protein
VPNNGSSHSGPPEILGNTVPTCAQPALDGHRLLNPSSPNQTYTSTLTLSHSLLFILVPILTKLLPPLQLAPCALITINVVLLDSYINGSASPEWFSNWAGGLEESGRRSQGVLELLPTMGAKEAKEARARRSRRKLWRNGLIRDVVTKLRLRYDDFCFCLSLTSFSFIHVVYFLY